MSRVSTVCHLQMRRPGRRFRDGCCATSSTTAGHDLADGRMFRHVLGNLIDHRRPSRPSPWSARRRPSTSPSGRRPSPGRRRRLEPPVQAPRVAQLVGRRPDAGAEPGQERRAERRRLHDLRALDRHARAGRPGSGRAGRWRRRRRRRAATTGAAGPSASTTSRTSKAIASSVARTRCAAGGAAGDAEDRAAGVRVPVGAPSPVSAGTNTTPSVSGTVRAIASVSAAEPTICRPSRSHCTAAPVTKIAPSIA